MFTRRSAALILMVCAALLVMGNLSAAYAATQTYNGDVIQMFIGDTAAPDIKVKPSTDPSGAYVTQYYADSSWGSVVWLNNAGTWSSFGSGYPSPGTMFAPVSNVTNAITGGTQIVTVVDLAAGVRMTQTFTHMTGDRFVSKEWVIHNGGSTTFSGAKFYHGGDTYFGGSDSARGYYDASKSMVYIRNNDYTNWGIMGFYANPGTPADRYFEGNYGTATTYMSSGTNAPNTVDSNYVDAGYCLEWDRAGLAPGATWTIQAYEVWTPAGALQMLAPGTQNAVPNSTVTLPFTVQNLGSSPLNLTLAASSVAGWATSLPGGSSVTVPANTSLTQNVQVTVPTGASGSSAVNLTASGDAVGAAQTTLNIVNVDLGISPSSIDFGSIAPGGSASQLVTVTNNSGDPVTFGTVSTAAPFGKSSDNISGVTLAAGGSATVMATFSSSSAGGHSGSLSIPVTSPTLITRTIPLTGAVVTNRAPVARADSATTAEDTLLTVAASGVLANDTDADGDPLSAVLVSGVSHGLLTLNADGSYTYSPAADYNGSDSFTYRAYDGLAYSNTVTVSITVTAVNDAPVARNDTATTDEDVALHGTSVLANDADVDGDALTAVLVSGPAHGGIALASAGTYTYTPDANWNGTDSFTYKTNDGQLDSNVATVTITVDPVNDAPVARADSATTAEDTLLTVAASGVLANDTDADGDPLSAVLVSGVSHGLLTLNADGSYTYSPAADYNGSDSFTYRAYDGLAYSNTVTVSITVTAVNDAPVARNDTATTDEDVALHGTSVLANDADVDGDALTAVLVSGPAHGGIALASAGTYTYTPDANWNGTDSFTYKANDGQLDSNVATVTITVNPVNDAPVARNDTATTDEDVTLRSSSVLANDTDIEGSPLTAVRVTNVSHGTLSLLADGTYTYMPDANWNGTDFFTYKANDGELDSNTATVTITVNAVNDAPSFTAGPNVTVAEDSGAYAQAWASNVVAGPPNESDQSLSVRIVVSAPGLFASQPVMDPAGRLSFSPAADANGSADCTVTITDNGVPALSTSARFRIMVTAVNDAPIARADSATTAEDTQLVVDAAHGVLANATDIDGPSLTAVLVNNVAHGTLVLRADGSYTYTPTADFNGADSFTYKANDDALDSNTVTVSITVSPVNDAPVALADSYSTDEGQPLTVSAASGVLHNDSDVDGDTLSAVLVGNVAHGTLALHANGSFTYTPDADWHGSDSFTYKANDGHADSNTVTVTIAVAAVNHAPVAHADTAQAVSGVELAVGAAAGVLANDTDHEGSALTAHRVDGPAHGTLVLQENGGYEYTPAVGFSGVDSFTYRAFDGTDYSGPASVTITVSPAPLAGVTFAITSPTTTKVSWAGGEGSTGFEVYVDGVLVGTGGSQDTSFTIPTMVGPGSSITVRATGGGSTQTPPVEADKSPTSSARLGTVYFVGDSPKLTAAATKILRANAALIKAKGFKAVTVEGFTSKGPGSTAAYRAKLSTARANAVKAYLLAQFKALHITVAVKAIGSGYAHPVGGPTNPKNRRAEITVK